MENHASQQSITDTAFALGGSWKLKITHGDDKTVAEVWAFGALLSTTTLTTEGDVTAEVPQTS